MVACSHGCSHLQIYRFVRVSCRWSFFCFSEQSNFFEVVCFREARFERSFSLRCSHCADVGFLSDCHSLAVRCTAMRFCSFSTAQVLFVERNARDKRTALRILLVAPLVSMRTRTLQTDRVFATKTRSRKNASEHRKRTRCASRSDFPKLVVPILVVGAVEVAETCAAVLRQVVVAKSGAPSTWRARDAPAIVYSTQYTTAHFRRLRTPANGSTKFFLRLQDPSKQGFSLKRLRGYAQCVTRTPLSAWTARRSQSLTAMTRQRTRPQEAPLSLFSKVMSPTSNLKSWLCRLALTQDDSGLSLISPLFWINDRSCPR